MNRSLLAITTLGLSLLLQSSRGNAWQEGSAEVQHPAAQVALFVLRVTVEGAASTRQYSVWPSVAPLSPQEAGRALAALKKPVHCSGRMDGAILIVGCRPQNQADALEHLRRAGAHRAALETDLRERCSEPVGRATLLLRRGRTAMVVPFDALEEWLRDYDMEFSLGGVQSAPPPQGVCTVFEVQPGPTIKIKDHAGSHRS